ncbi:sporulation-delaying protein SdpB family protein [Flavobacterium sp. RHBU_3]|uniref:sporulation-delaying protein SdpB family protein n=1 Tax=Flavobacterium sp. RHBU_3 TaxID=3391184 RepID=UPI003984626B
MKYIDKKINEIISINPWTNVYGASRSLLALASLLTLLFNDASTIFRPILGIDEYPICTGTIGGFSLFCLFSNHLGVAMWIAILILFLVVIGIYPRFTGILHWWINFSLISSSPLVDGGEHVAAVISLLLVPITLMDDRKWHWTEVRITQDDKLSKKAKRLVAISAYQVIRIQVAVIYLHAAVAKCSVPEWANGTALFYWFNDEMFGLSYLVKPIISPLINNGYTLTLFTWSIVILEFFLFAGLFMKPKYRRTLLFFGIVFHAGIALVHGLISFALIMIGALVIFLQPIDQNIVRVRKKAVNSRFKPAIAEG